MPSTFASHAPVDLCQMGFIQKKFCCSCLSIIPKSLYGCYFCHEGNKAKGGTTGSRFTNHEAEA
jgi:hypothetical protein